MSFVDNNGVEQRGQFIVFESDAGAEAECSPMNFISLSVDPGESFKSSYLSNQNTWQRAQRSMVTGKLRWASISMDVISAAQFGQFTAITSSTVRAGCRI
jgi:hypothetical protein